MRMLQLRTALLMLRTGRFALLPHGSGATRGAANICVF